MKLMTKVYPIIMEIYRIKIVNYQICHNNTLIMN